MRRSFEPHWSICDSRWFEEADKLEEKQHSSVGVEAILSTKRGLFKALIKTRSTQDISSMTVLATCKPRRTVESTVQIRFDHGQ